MRALILLIIVAISGCETTFPTIYFTDDMAHATIIAPVNCESSVALPVDGGCVVCGFLWYPCCQGAACGSGLSCELVYGGLRCDTMSAATTPLCRTQSDCALGTCLYASCAAPLGRCMSFDDGGACGAAGLPSCHRTDEPHTSLCVAGTSADGGACETCGCGSIGASCCIPDMGLGGNCSAGLTCNRLSFVCVPCGGDGEACCGATETPYIARTCTYLGDRCRSIPPMGICDHCGSHGAACCTTYSTCDDGLSPSGGMCVCN